MGSAAALLAATRGAAIGAAIASTASSSAQAVLVDADEPAMSGLDREVAKDG